MKAVLATFLLLLSVSAQASCVILLHGLGRTERSLSELERKLGDAGFEVVNLGYPSRKHAIETLTGLAIEPALQECSPDSEIDFVTHSLGGILVRQYLLDNEIDRLHRVVMLGPPNQGSELVDKLGKVPGFYLINGNAGRELSTEESAIPKQLGAANFEVGVIAGTRTLNPFYSALIPGRDDGKVSVESSKLEGMSDHIEMATTHSFMMNNNAVIAQTIHFLRNGSFDRSLSD